LGCRFGRKRTEEKGTGHVFSKDENMA
jgi:hypothetical protein